MRGDTEVLLNAVLTNELTGVNQYFLHAHMFRHWGYPKLGDCEYHESIDEMKHADALVARKLFLEALPNLHIDFLETQLGLITEVGLQNYLQSQMKPGDAS
jgi:bacterioferritin